MGNNIRNFALVAHIDHGKSTLADRLMEKTGLLPPADDLKSPRIDRMELEIERGVTIKLKAVRMAYGHPAYSAQQTADSKSELSRCKPLAVSGKPYVLNMIDTPGHVDFSYEVSRSLAACEGVLLLVDATQGPQAQTVAHLEKARELGLAVIGVINKIDSPLARTEEVEEEMRALGIEGEILEISALMGTGIENVLEAIISRIPPPKGNLEGPFRALVFDSTYDEYLGVIAYVRIVDGALEIKNQKSNIKNKIKFIGTGAEVRIKEVGFFTPDRKPTDGLSAGEIGYLATGLKDPRAVRVGDTAALVSQLSNHSIAQLPGYQPPQSFVFASFYSRPPSLRSESRIHDGGRETPDSTSGPTAGDFSELKQALSRLRLEEPAVSVEEISSPAFGRGFKLGFLGTFHLDIVKERLEREFDLELIVTKPAVQFRDLKEEPWIRATIFTPPEYLSGVIKLVRASRGKVGETAKFGRRLRISVELPLMEFIRGFYDQLKSLSSGYASLDWEFADYRPADLVKLDVAVHNEVVEGLSEIVLKDQAQRIGKEKVRKLKEVMPRTQFAYALQAKVGGKVIAREDVPALRKDVTAPLYGGDVTRKRKLLKKQRKGKKQLAEAGRIEVPPKAFLV